jgi:hypothetical protein
MRGQPTQRRDRSRTGTGAQLPKLPPRPGSNALSTRKYPAVHSCGSKLQPTSDSPRLRWVAAGPADGRMTAHSAHMMAPQDDAGAVMRATIGPERKLFETSLPRAKARKQRTPLASTDEGSVAHRMSKFVRSMLVGSVEMRLFDTRLQRDPSAHGWAVTAGEGGLPLTR